MPLVHKKTITMSPISFNFKLFNKIKNIKAFGSMAKAIHKV